MLYPANPGSIEEGLRELIATCAIGVSLRRDADVDVRELTQTSPVAEITSSAIHLQNLKAAGPR